MDVEHWHVRGGTGIGVCLPCQQSHVHYEASSPSLSAPSPLSGPRSDMTVINAPGQDDDNNDHN